MVAIDEDTTNGCCCSGIGTGGGGMLPTGPDCNPGGGAVPNRCAAVVAGPVASELAADVTSLGGGTLWNCTGLGAGGCCEAVGGGGIGPTIGDVTVAGIIGTTIVGEAPIWMGFLAASGFCGGGFAIVLAVGGGGAGLHASLLSTGIRWR